MGDKRVATRLSDVITAAERRVANSAALWVRVGTDQETAFWKRLQQLRQFVRHGESASE